MEQIITGNILIISDLHLADGTNLDDFGKKGETEARELALIDFINAQSPIRVYLNGDIYELWQTKMKRIRQAHPTIIHFFESDPRIRFLVGNHDLTLTGKSTAEFMTKSGKKVLISHGFQNDLGMSSAIMRFWTWIIGKLEILIHPDIDRIGDIFFKNQNKEILMEKVRDYAAKQLIYYDICICGHSHYNEIGELNGKPYANSGGCIWGKIEGILLDCETDELSIVKKL